MRLDEPSLARRGGGVGCLLCIPGFCFALAMWIEAHLRHRDHDPVILAFACVAVVAIPTVLLVRRGWWGADRAQPAGALLLDGQGGRALPTTVTCPQCGGTVRLRLLGASRAECRYCGVPVPVAPDIAAALAHGEQILAAQDVAERRVTEAAVRLAERQRTWARNHAIWTTLGLLAAAAVAGLGVRSMGFSRQWVQAVFVGTGAGLVTAILAAMTAYVVPATLRSALGAWTALRMPDGIQLACRVCGDELVAAHQPVLRCAACGADNLASKYVLKFVELRARHTQAFGLASARRQDRTVDAATLALWAIPIAVPGMWLALIVTASTLVRRYARETEIGADNDIRYHVVRVGTPAQACLGLLSEGTLRLSLDDERPMSADVLPAYEAGPTLDARSLVGREVTASTESGRVERVFSMLDAPWSNKLRLRGAKFDHDLPARGATGRVCFAEAAPPGASLVPRGRPPHRPGL